MDLGSTSLLNAFFFSLCIMQEIISRKSLFGKYAEIAVYDTDEYLARSVMGEAYIEGQRLQKIFNFFDSKSEMSILNANNYFTHSMREIIC